MGLVQGVIHSPFIGIFVCFFLAVFLALPLVKIARSEKKLTWSQAVMLGTLLFAIGLLLIADVPSKIMYLFSSQHAHWGDMFAKPGFWHWLSFLKGDMYLYVSDVVANTVQGIFFVIIVLLAYLWGEKQRRTGRFKA